MRSHIEELSDEHGDIGDKDRDRKIFHPTEEVSLDLVMVAAVMADTYNFPLPIVDPDPPIPLCAAGSFSRQPPTQWGMTHPSGCTWEPSPIVKGASPDAEWHRLALPEGNPACISLHFCTGRAVAGVQNMG